MSRQLKITYLASRGCNKAALRFISRLGFIVLVCFTTGVLHAQTAISATLTADSNHILIGDHLQVKLALKHPKSFNITMPAVKDSVGNMEFISASKIDTVNDVTFQTYVQTYTVSAFDSGAFHAGPIAVYYKKTDGVFDTLFSNVIMVNVSTLPVDTARPFKDIKAPLAVPYSWREFMPYIIGASILIVLIIIGVILWIRYKTRPVAAARPMPKDPAHIWARKELKKLEDEKLWQNNDVKQYYIRLTEILRLYLEYRFNWLALESTTEEIEMAIDQYKMKEKAKENLLKILRVADLVKFAKMVPPPDTNINSMDSAYKFIELTEPKEEELKKS